MGLLRWVSDQTEIHRKSQTDLSVAVFGVHCADGEGAARSAILRHVVAVGGAVVQMDGEAVPVQLTLRDQLLDERLVAGRRPRHSQSEDADQLNVRPGRQSEFGFAPKTYGSRVVSDLTRRNGKFKIKIKNFF